MVEETLTIEQVAKLDTRKEIAQIVGDYVDLGEVSVGDNEKIRLTIATVNDIDDQPIRVLRVIKGESNEDLSDYCGTGNEIEMSQEEKVAFQKCLTRKMPLMSAAYLAFNETTQVDKYLDKFPQYPKSDDEVQNAITLGITGPSSQGKTTLLSHVAEKITNGAIFERMDVFSRTTIADYLEISARGTANGSTVAEVARIDSVDSYYKKLRNSSRLTMKTKLLSFAANLGFNRNNFHSTVFFDNPSTFNFSEKRREPDVFDLVVLEGLDGVIPIGMARNVLSDVKKTEHWCDTVRQQSNTTREYLLKML